MKDAGCTYISFGFESASDKVLKEDIQKGQTRNHLQITINTIREVQMRPLTTFMIGNEHENINDLMETVDFWIKNNIEIDPFICTPYVGSPIYFNNKRFLLSQYNEKLNYVEKLNVEKSIIKKWELEALDKFMTECGDATLYTGTISKYFTIPELIALKRFMYKHETDRMLQMAHQRFDQPGLEQWNHEEKWKKYCPICLAKDELALSMKVLN